MSSQEPSTVSELFTRIARGRADLETWSVTLSEAELSAPRKDGWAIKDHLIHLAVWELSVVTLLCGEPRFPMRGMTPGNPEPTNADELNAQIFAQNKDRSAQDARNLFHTAHMELLGELAKLSDADLLKPYSHFQPNENGADEQNPVLGWIVGNTYGHYEEHIAWIREQLGS